MSNIETKTGNKHQIEAVITRSDGTKINLGVIASNFTWRDKIKFFFKKLFRG